MGTQGEWWDAVPTPIKWLIIGAMLSGVSSGAVNLNKDTSDRYHASTAAKDFAVRDARIKELERRLQGHLEHSATYTQVIKDHEGEISHIDEELEDHIRNHR